MTSNFPDAPERLRAELRRLLDDAHTPADREAISCERVFSKRFGKALAKADRIHMIEFQSQSGLSDSEIRWLHRANALRKRGGTFSILPSDGFAMWGWFQIAALWLIFALPG